MANKKGQPNLAPLLVLMGLCLCLSAFNFVIHLPEYIQSLFIHVEHPLTYEFTAYNQLLQQAVKGDLVDYEVIKKSKLLDQAVDELARTSPEDLEDNDKKLCFWINAYNLSALKALADRYPQEIMKMNGRVLALNTTMHVIGGKTYKLEQIWAELLPKLRAHGFTTFLVCEGRRGDPPLLNHALNEKTFLPDGKAAFLKYIKDRQNVIWNSDSEVLCLSPFFKWTETIWGPNISPAGAVVQYMKEAGLPDPDSIMFVKYNLPFNNFLNDTNLKIVPQGSESDVATKKK